MISMDEFEVVRGNLSGAGYAAVVIRPDRYVFGHTDSAYSIDALIISLGEKLHLI